MLGEAGGENLSRRKRVSMARPCFETAAARDSQRTQGSASLLNGFRQTCDGYRDPRAVCS